MLCDFQVNQDNIDCRDSICLTIYGGCKTKSNVKQGN